AQTKDRPWAVRRPMTTDPLHIRAASQWEDAHGVSHDLDDEATVSGDTLVALGPYKDLLSLTIIPAASWTEVTQLRVELRYSDSDSDYVAERSLLFDPTHNASQTIQIPLLQPALRKYQWRQVVVRKDGTVDQTEWAETDKGLLVVGAAKKTTADVRVVWIGSPGNAFGLRVDFWVTPVSGDDQNVSIFLRAGADNDKTATPPLDGDGRLQYRYEIRRLSAGGEDLMKSGTGTTALLLAQ